MIAWPAWPTRSGSDPATGSAHPQTEAHVRGATRAAHPTDLQHRKHRPRHREPTKHDGDARRDDAGEQGVAQTIRKYRRRQDRGAPLHSSIPRTSVNNPLLLVPGLVEHAIRDGGAA
jgi:hypothetical protein